MGVGQIGRQRRNFKSGECYHIVQRGHNRDHIFASETSKAVFLNMIRALRDKYRFRLLYYVLMDNHYHLVVQMQDVPVNRIIQRLNWKYCKYFNKKHKHTGTAYDGRYAAYHVADERQFMSLIHYIAHNPVKADMAVKPSDYRWSAHYDILTGDTALIDLNILMKLFNPDPDLALAAYYAFIEGIPEEIMKRDDAIHLKRLRRRKALQVFARQNHYDSDFYDADSPGRGRDHIIIRRRQFVVEGRMIGFTNSEIAQYLGTSQSTISRIWRSVRLKDPSQKPSGADP